MKLCFMMLMRLSIGVTAVDSPFISPGARSFTFCSKWNYYIQKTDARVKLVILGSKPKKTHARQLILNISTAKRQKKWEKNLFARDRYGACMLGARSAIKLA